jgi:hypothetical protein
MNSAWIKWIEVAGKSKYALIASCFVLAYAIFAMSFKKERAAIRLAAFIAILALFGLAIVRLLPSPVGNTSPGVTTRDVQVNGNGNGTAVGKDNSVTVNGNGEQTKPGDKK